MYITNFIALSISIVNFYISNFKEFGFSLPLNHCRGTDRGVTSHVYCGWGLSLEAGFPSQPTGAANIIGYSEK